MEKFTTILLLACIERYVAENPLPEYDRSVKNVTNTLLRLDVITPGVLCMLPQNLVILFVLFPPFDI